MADTLKDLEGSIAVVGLAGRFPGALDAARFWENVRAGVESVRFLSEEEALALGVPPEVLADPDFVRAVAQPDDVDRFDALFFGVSHREAELLDPQQRVFLETAWEALEDAGYEPGRTGGDGMGVVGVFAGATTSTYLIFNLLADPVLARSGDPLQLLIGNISDTLATRVSYKLDLKGPSYTVQSACSSSLVAVHNACQSLLSGECDMALAGGVSINVAQSAGYRYQRESIASPDGHCRAFDARAQGTVFGGGAGVVVLKRLEDALRDGDTVRAVIRGSAVNNDGALKVGYTAPSVAGQAEVVAEALGAAGVEAESISYIEAHGTGTRLGDPIEIQALTRAFREETDRTGFCALGSVKSNIGHLDIAAGVAGLIKTVLALEHREIPPTLNISAPSPEIDWAASPVYLNTALTPWETDGGTPRRAGVSSFGIGGTNAHLILEEAPAEAAATAPAARPWQLLVLSARSAAALDAMTVRLAAHLESHPVLDGLEGLDGAALADVAWTLQAGRRTFFHRRAVVCRDKDDALRALSSADPARAVAGVGTAGPRRRPVAFLFSGQGSQHPGMGKGLYDAEPVFRREIDRCAALLRPHLAPLGNLDLREALWGAESEGLSRTALAQPALFAFEYALARQWMEWGIAPESMLGHSLGEYVAACLAGVLPLEDALRLVAVRGRLMQELPAGAMTAVTLAEAEVVPLLGPELSVAAVNEPGRCVVSGPVEAIEAFERRLAAEGKGFRRLHTSHAFHSAMMEPILGRFREEVRQVKLAPPRLPWVSNLTGTWITAAEATDPADPEYWVRHLRQPVRFADGVAALLADPERLLLEVGPGNALTTLARAQATAAGRGGDVVASARHPREKSDDLAVLLLAAGRLFVAGLEIDWQRLHAGERRRRVPLPTYPFERNRYWIGGRGAVAAGAAVNAEAWTEPVAEPVQTLHSRPHLASAYEPPRTVEEEVLAGLWQELLGVAPVGIHDDFFELGGHSLLGTQLIARLRDAFGIELPLEVLFDVPTVARLAEAVVAAGGVPRGARALPAIPLADRGPHGDRPLPLSFGQQRLWFIDQLEPGNPLYNEPRGLRLTGPLAVPVLAAALSEVVRRHEVLRTTFAAVQGDPVQVITPAAASGALPVPIIDLAGLPEAVREAELRRLAVAEAARPFDLAAGPLLRFLLFRLAAEEHAAVFNAHHIATDGWSMGVLVREAGALYDARLAGRPSPLPELPIQYADFAAWQREHLAGERLAEQLAWWRGELAGAPQLLPLATDRPRPPLRSPRGAAVPLLVPAELAAAIESLALGGTGGTPFMVLMAAFQALLFRQTGARDLLVGFPVAGRPRPETEPLIGFFVNTLPLRARPAADLTWGELLGQVRTAVLGALAHQELPFERLLDEVAAERSLAYTPLVQVALALQNTPLPELALSGLTIVPWEIHAGTAKFDLSVSLTRTPEGLAGAIEYATDLFDAATVQRLAGQLTALLRGAVEAPGTLLAELPLLSAAERHQVEIEWNDTRVTDEPECLHEVFEAQAEARPEAPALVFEDESVTYGELNRRATQLAEKLLTLGIGPESRVGIFVETGVHPLVASIAVLKAGGTYVPLDVSYPEERLVFMLDDAGVRVLLTQERLRGSLPHHRAEVVLADEAGEPDGKLKRRFTGRFRRPDPDGIAYITYTSGSTGKPNGVMTRHRSAARIARQSAADFAIGPSDRVLQAASWSFDGWVQETWGALAVGATLCGVRRESQIGGEALEEAIRRMGVTAAFLTPGRLATLAPENVPGLVSVACGGEAFPGELAARWAPGRRLLNCYGPTETTVYTMVQRVHARAGSAPQDPSIGRPYAGAQIYLVDRGGRLVPPGSPGELCIAGEGMARGYLNRPALTAARFVPHPFAARPGERLYRTGDLARHRADGTIEFLGRIDHQVKLRGLRIELGEIETVLGRHPRVRETRVVVRPDGPGGEKRLVGYVLPAGAVPPTAAELRAELREQLPEHMVPAAFAVLDAWPLTPNGKIDLKALPAPEAQAAGAGTVADFAEPRGATERAIARAWQEVLGVDRVGRVGARDNFFDIGGHSLLMPRLHARLKEALGERGRHLTLVDLFRFPTVAALAGFLHPAGSEPEPLERSRDRALARQGALEQRDRRIAIVGMSGRFPGAADVDRYWENLANGIESIRRLTAEELARADPALVADPRHVPVVALPDGIERFDALFFGLSHREAELLDPQQRLFLEVAWEALEDAGHDPERSGRAVGVFAGTALSTYLLYHLMSDEEVRRTADPVQLLIANGADSLATRVSYKLGLKGPSYTVQSACSTSLVAVHHACQSLLAGECDLALAGGSSLPLGNRLGYVYQEGSIASPDGHCRAFDAGARGTVFGGGAGAVVLKRLDDALRDGDTVRAVLLGSAVNNDGDDKIGYTAPSVTGQAEVIAEALAVAGVEPSTISYVETHGTGTPVGDPIEIAALTQVIGAAGRSAPCAIGSVKTNFGHLDSAAGAAGLIKTVLALQHRQIPPSLHFASPNPEIDFGGSLVVNATLAPWEADGTPRRAGVSSFGIGGTNAHVVVEEAPRTAPAPSARQRHLLVLSARSEEALDEAARRLAAHLDRHPETGLANLADVAWTLGTGRRGFPARRIAVVHGREDAVRVVSGFDPDRVADAYGVEPGPRSVAFLLSGQGSQYPGMGRGLYEDEPVFRREIDRAAEILKPILGLDLRGVIFPAVADAAAEERLRQTALAQPALFAFEYALAQLWMEQGIAPAALLGHSVGEYVAACLAGVFPVEDALRLVAVRGQLMQEMPPGAMVAVALPEEEVAPLLGADLAVAAVNEPGRSVVAGPFEAVAELELRLAVDGVACRRLHTSHAFHSAMMEPVRERFTAEVRKVRLDAPRLPFLSNVTGTWITPEEAADPEYWARHLRAPVRFAAGIAELLREDGRILLEIGPGNALASLARSQADPARVIASVRHPRESAADGDVFLGALSRLWLAGLPLDWARLYPGEPRRRVPLPTYPFERQRYWIESGIEAGKFAAREETKAAAAVPSATRGRHARPRLSTPFVAPRDPAEREIAAIWQELLGIDEVGVDDDFFALGGHSLLGTQLLSRVSRAFGTDLPLDLLFEEPTVAGLAQRVGPAEQAAPLIPRTGLDEGVLSFAQERLWFFHRLDPASAVYNLPAVLRLEGDLDVPALAASFDAVVRRQAALRTTFGERDGAPFQRVAPHLTVPLPVADLSGLPAPEAEREAERQIAVEVARPFDLSEGPLVRLLLVRTAASRWLLGVDVHHIVSDGWSAGVLVQEITALYAAALQGTPARLPELPVQYLDFALWQREWLTGPVLDEQLGVWRRALAGAPALLDMPTDRPRPAQQSFRGATVPVSIPAETATALRTLARRAEATPFMVLLAAFQALLHRITAAGDVLVGSPIANRHRIETEGLVGFFVNTLVFRTQLGPEESFLAVLERDRAAALAGHAHQDLPFELLVEALGVPRSLAHNPLFQVMLVLLNAPAGELRAPGLTLAPVELPGTTAKFDLTLTLTEAGGGFAGTLEYATDLFDRSTIVRMAGHLLALVGGAAAAPERCLCELPLLSAAERHQTTVEWTAARREPAPEASLDQLFSLQAARTPEAVAVSSPEESLSYAELDRRSDRLAARLAALGVGPEVPVVLLLPRSAALVVAVLGVLKAGGCYVPLDPAYPAERLRLIALDCQAPVVVTVPELAPSLPEIPAEVVLLHPTDRSDPSDRPVRPRLEDTAAYVIYTSGSTGVPKGVIIEHRQVTRLFQTTRDAYGFSSDDVWTLFHSYAFDFSVWEIWGALLYGGRLVVVPYETSRSPADFYRLLCREQVTVLNQTPSAFGQLIRAEEEIGVDSSLALRWVIFGGEALTPRSLAGFAARHPEQPRLVNMYGITETTVHVTIYPIGEADLQADRSPIGRPIPDLEAWVLGSGGSPAPIGVPGELCVGGPGLARGYLGRPELTAQRFVPHPFAQSPGERLYRSGDLVRLLPDGGLEYFGRIDHQVKIRGFRIELGEIEAALDRHPGVRESRVLVRDAGDTGGDRRLVAWFVPAVETPEVPEASVLRDHLREQLPEHMVPAAFVPVAAWPLTPNGKVDLKALPAPARGVTAVEGPRTATETQVAEIWTELLDVAAPGREESFFELGGHSLLATRLLSRVRKGFEVEIPLRDLFETPTIAGLAGRIEAARAQALQEPPLVPLEMSSGIIEAPLSFAQERLWFLDRLQPDSSVYNIPAVLRLTGDLNVEALRRSFEEIVRRHATLRTAFAESGGEPRQVVAPAAPVSLPVLDLSGLPASQAQAEAEQVAAAEIDRPFDLAHGPVLRLLLLRHGPREHTLIANVHHIASDGWSMGVLVDESTVLYQAFVEGRPSPLPALPIQYTDFAVWQRSWLTGPALEAQLGFWRRELAGAPALLELPADRPRPAAQSFRGAASAFTLTVEATAAVRELARRADATPFMVLLAAFQTLLHRISGAEDVPVGSPVANRNRVQLEGLIGFFVNTLVFVMRLDGGESFATALEQVRATALAAHDHQDLPFELLVESLGVPRSLAHNPLFQVMLVLQNAPAGELRVPGLTFAPAALPSTAAKVDLSLVLYDTEAGLAGTVEYATDLFDAPTARRLLSQLEVLLAGAARDPERPLSELPLLSAAERHQVGREWNDTLEEGGAFVSVPSQIAAQAASTPEAVAIARADGAGRALTYGELAGRAERLAHRLRALGVGPEVRVGLLAERTPELAVGLLGILRAGGAFVPLDPHHPADRLAFVLGDALHGQEVRVVVATPGAGRENLPADLTVVSTQEAQASLEGEEAYPSSPPRALPWAKEARAFGPTAPLKTPSASSGVVSGPTGRDSLAQGNALGGEDGASKLAPIGDGGEAAGEPGEPLPDADPASLAYVLYTSGTTGRPKGVLVAHGQLAHTMTACRGFGFAPGERTVAVAPSTFDIFLFELLPALLCGGTVGLVPLRPALEIADLAVELRSGGHFHAVPALMRQVADRVRRDSPEGIAAVHGIYVGGDAVPPDLIGDLGAAFPAARVRVLYGPTEGTIICASFNASGTAPLRPVQLIGRPLPGSALSVRDPLGSPLPMGVSGELWLRGPSVTRGYLGRPDLTAERFVPAAGGGRWYRTGDRVRSLPDGTLEFLGRTDRQVKIRGVRVEPGEIEAVLARQPDVKEAVVLAREDGHGGLRLVAYLVPVTEEPPDVADLPDLRARLARELPEVMIPSAFVTLAAFPLTAHGKVDRKALPAPEQEGRGGAAAPRTRTERELAGIWRALLRVERVGRHDDFFALGGHSLLATRVASRIKDTFGVDLPLRTLFEAPTLAALAARIASAGTSETGPEPPLVVTGATEAPLSFAQERLWFLDRLLPGSALYNMPAILRLTGGLDVAALRRSFEEIARRHGTLRTTYAEVRGEHRQTVAPASAVQLPIIDLSALPGEEGGAEAGRLIAQEAGRPFDLGRGPVLRLCLLRHGGREHTLIANVHHIASDGWSMGVLVQESTALYEAFVQGLPSPLPELPIQYVDFAVWQRSWLTGPVLDAQLDFWRHELAGAPALLELPADRPRPAAQSYRGAFLPFPLTEGTAAVHALAERADATPFMVLLAAFQILLHRTAGADDVLVGSPVANRQRVAVEGLIGFFVNTLVYRLEVRPEEGFLTVLERVRAAALAAQEHQDLPFELLVETLGVERSLARNPLFQVMLAFQNAPAGELRAPDLTFTPLDLPISTSKFDLSLTLTESEAGLTGAFEYATDLFDSTTIARLAERLSVLLAGAFAEPERRLSELPLLSAAERHQVLRESTAARREPESGERETLDRLFARQAERTPHAVAVSSPEESLSYADLDRRSSRLAARLQELGIGPEIPVVLLLPRSAALVVAVLGVLKAGGCYVPLDPAYPAERLRMIALDCQPPVVVTVSELAGKLPPLGAVVLDVDEASRTETPPRRRPGRRPALHQTLQQHPPLPHLAGNAAYVIYTSGSTGTPKGVMVEHRQVTRLFRTAQETYGFGPDDVWTLFHSYAFDFSVWEIWGALLHGGRLVVVPYETSRSPEDFYQLLCQERVTVLNQTPSAFGQLIRAEEELGADPSLSLRWVIFGGEALTPRSLAGFAARHPQQPRLVNMYGITETTVHVTVHPLGAEDFQADRSPIGRALPDLEAWVLEPGGEPAPLGVPGELCVGGPGLARGYLERPELTAQRFVPHPFSQAPGERLYRSGDLVRRLPGGGLEYFGRIDHQVKIRGFRIELGEIEAALDCHPGVRESRVLVHGEGGDRRLAAWFVPEGEAPEEQALRALLREQLPEHMVPAFFVAVDAWPLTPNGKVDAKALPAPQRPGRAAAETELRTTTERQVAALWSELLGIPNPGRDESFFELGGHSLLATLLLTRVRETLGVDLPLRALFEDPTVAGFAARIDALQAPQPPLPVPVKAELESETAEAPLSFSQERLWFLDRLQPGSPLYNIPAVLRLTGKLDTAALQRSFREIVRRHGVLRTVFAETDGEPRQRVTPAAPVPLPLIDLSGLPPGKGESGTGEAERLAMEEILRPFDLERGPMLRLLLLRHRRREHTLIANVHHIASDGWSLGILVREATALYQAFSQGLQTPLPELPRQYLDFALWQRRQLSGETLAAQLAFWRHELAGAPTLLDLPADRPRPAVQSSRGAIFAFDLPPQAAAAVHALARLAGATPFMVLLAAFQTLLHLWSGADDVLVGSPVANRNRVEDEGLIGFFVNTLVFRLRFGEEKESFRTVLERVRATALACHAHQDVPLELLMEALGVQRSLAHNPLFQVMLSLQNTPAGELKVPGLTFSPVDPPGTTAKFDLTFVFTERKERGGGFAGTIEYATDLFGAATVQRLAVHFANLLTAAAADPDAGLAELRLMDADEERLLRHGLNGLNGLKATERSWALPIAVHDLFVQQARRTPENTAAIGPWGTMTYRELDERSSELAGLIRRIME